MRFENLFYRRQFSVFSFLFIFFIIFNFFPILIRTFDGIVNLYLTFVSVFFLALLYQLSKLDALKIDFEAPSRRILNSAFIFFVITVVYYIIVNDNSFLDLLGEKTPAQKYKIRLDGIAVRFYWLLEASAKIGLVVSIIALLKRMYLTWIVSTVLYSLFYFYTLQKEPIGSMLVLQALVYFSRNRLTRRSLSILLVGLVLVILYYGFIVLGDTGLGRVDLLLSALYSRVSVAGELVSYTYNYTFDTGLRLNGATFPKVFGLIDLNFSGGYTVRLPALIMMARTGSVGGANTVFFTEGLANFGVFFDLVFILLLVAYVFILVTASRLVHFQLHGLYKLLVAVFIVDLVHSDFWGFFHSSGVMFVLFALLGLFFKKSGANKNLVKRRVRHRVR